MKEQEGRVSAFHGRTDSELIDEYPYQFRFRDPEFVTIWKRWRRASNDWRSTWPGLDMRVPVHFSDDECPDHPVAREFVAARRDYLNDISRRSNKERSS